MPQKRKLATRATIPSAKKIQTTLTRSKPEASLKFESSKPTAAGALSSQPFVQSADYDEGIVDRKYYPLAGRFSAGNTSDPMSSLKQALSSTAGFRTQVVPGRSVIHWFRTDLRIDDNTGLHLASKVSASATTITGHEGCALIGLYIISPQDLDAHVVAPARLDFILRSLEVVRKDLAERNIPLWIETVSKRKGIPAKIMELAQQWGSNHVFANMEYEVDELRRDAELVHLGERMDVAVNVLHDTCVVPPGELLTKSTGKSFSVYSPWFRAFVAHLNQNPERLDLRPPPSPNHVSVRERFVDVFSCSVPSAPRDKQLTTEEAKTVNELFPAGSHEAHGRLTRFMEQKVSAYARDRNFPGKPGTSVLSPHFAAGTLSARTAVRLARDKNHGKLRDGHEGLNVWISEIAWRDFYKHILVAFPYVCMYKPFKPEFAFVKWCSPSLTTVRFSAWTESKTGYPIIDAAMRQLWTQKFLPNRLRMVVASFLCKDLHVDWRKGERYFSEHLVDGDFASNNGGWGWSASVGADPQPYFRIFNPIAQSEKFDPDGDYIRMWIPELSTVVGKAIHDPPDDVRKRVGYPTKIVDHAAARKIAVEMYKLGAEAGKKAL